MLARLDAFVNSHLRPKRPMRTALISLLALFVLLSFAVEAQASCEHDDRECQEWADTHLPTWSPHMGYAESEIDRICTGAIAAYGHRFRVLRNEGWSAGDPSFAASVTRPLAVATCKAVAVEARRKGIDPLLAVAIAAQESNFDPGAVGPSGERGPLQAQEYHCPDDRCDGIEEAIESAVGYLVSLNERARSRGQAKMVGAYHCGWAGSGGDRPGVTERCYDYHLEVAERMRTIRMRAG